MSVFVIGATGLCGALIVKQLEKAAQIKEIITLGRRNVEGEKINSIVATSTDEWPEIIKTKGNGSQVFFSGFGTTRGDAGGIANFKLIDIDVNLNAAKAAKEAGIDTYVLVSSKGASSSSFFPYLKLKGELEEEVIKLGFKKTIILRPGALLGERTKPKGLLNSAGIFVGKISRTFMNGLATEAEEVAKVGVSLALATSDEKVRIVEAADIVKLAKE